MQKETPPHKKENDENKLASWWVSKQGLVAISFIAVIGFYLIAEHRAHLLGYLPFLIFLLCPLMHLFMHHGHGDHDDKNHKK